MHIVGAFSLLLTGLYISMVSLHRYLPFGEKGATVSRNRRKKAGFAFDARVQVENSTPCILLHPRKKGVKWPVGRRKNAFAFKTLNVSDLFFVYIFYHLLSVCKYSCCLIYFWNSRILFIFQLARLQRALVNPNINLVLRNRIGIRRRKQRVSCSQRRQRAGEFKEQAIVAVPEGLPRRELSRSRERE